MSPVSNSVNKMFALPDYRPAIEISNETIDALIAGLSLDVLDFHAGMPFLEQMKAESFEGIAIQLLEPLFESAHCKRRELVPAYHPMWLKVAPQRFSAAARSQSKKIFSR